MQLELFGREMTTCHWCGKTHELSSTHNGETLDQNGQQDWEHFCSPQCKVDWWDQERERRWPPKVSCANCAGVMRKADATVSTYYNGQGKVTEYFCDDNCRRNLHIHRLNTR